MSDLLKGLMKELKDEHFTIAADGASSAEFGGYLDTGSYALNALLSGSIWGGVPDNKVTGFAGDPATGKTYFVLGIVQAFLESNPEGAVVYYDSEAAVTKAMMEGRGIDARRVAIAEPETIEAFRTHATRVLSAYEKTDAKKRPPLLIVLDSLGQLSSKKEMGDVEDGADTRDMTKAALLKGTFRVLTLKLARLKVPMLVTNHTYNTMSQYTPKELAGGTGLKYAASTIVTLSKSKDKDDKTKDVIGGLITAKTYKSRLSKENQEAEMRLSFTKGLDRYFGLCDLAVKQGVFKKLGNKLKLPNGVEAFKSEINNNGAKYFTDDILKLINEAAHREYAYGAEDELPEEEFPDEEA